MSLELLLLVESYWVLLTYQLLKFVSVERCRGEKAYLLDQMGKKIVEKEKGGLRVKDVALLMALIACKMKMRKIIKDDGSHGFK